ncbi:MAG TPA: molybdate ABC transporter substrate-binding protein [Geobacteraceae bacterium]
MKRAAGLIFCLICVFILTGRAIAGEVNLSIAASLREAINELSNDFSRKNPGVKIFKNYGASGALAKQIENGAPAHIFISANLEWMDYLRDRKLVALSGIGPFAYNTLVFVGATGKKASGMEDLPALDKIAIGSPLGVPAGEYAMAAIRKAGIDRLLAKKLVMARDVRDCLMYAERGEVDGAFVYRTDALQARRAKILFTIPQGLYPRVVYPMALTRSGAANRDAAAFFRYLQSGEARAVLGKYGFSVN